MRQSRSRSRDQPHCRSSRQRPAPRRRSLLGRSRLHFSAQRTSSRRVASQKHSARRRCPHQRISRRPTRTHHRSPQRADRHKLIGVPVIVHKFRRLHTTHFLFLITITLSAQKNPFTTSNPSWVQPFPAFKIAGNLYYVGSQDLAAYLIVTPQGNILINSNLESSPPQIKQAIQSLGFKYQDTKILLISPGHFDHCAGSAQIKRETGAKYEVMVQDVPDVESGGSNDFHYAHDKSMRFPAIKVDRALHDGDTVSLGGANLPAHLTAGHTRGTATWTLDEQENGRPLHIVIVGSRNENPG